MDSCKSTILQSRVRFPNTTSKLFHLEVNFVLYISLCCEKDKNKLKEALSVDCASGSKLLFEKDLRNVNHRSWLSHPHVHPILLKLFSGYNNDAISGIPASEITSIVNLVTTFMLLSIVMTILMPILSGRVVVVPNTNRIDDDNDDVGVIKSLENLFFGGSKKSHHELESQEGQAGYYDENGYYHSKFSWQAFRYLKGL